MVINRFQIACHRFFFHNVYCYDVAICSSIVANDALAFSFRVLKVPIGFSSNVKRLVSMKYLSLISFQAYDCHMMLTVFLPIAIRTIKAVYVRMVITQMCYFFN